MRVFFVLAVIIMNAVLCPGAQSRSAEPGKEWVRSHPFTVSALVAHKPWNSTLYRACNLNSVHVWFSDVSLCQAVAADGLPWHFTIQATGVTSTMINTVNTLSSSYGDNGWYLFDEPSPDLLPGIASASNWFKSNRPNSLIYINLAGYDPSYIDNVVQTVGPDALMYDSYPFSTILGVQMTYDNYSDSLFTTLMGYRSKTQQYNIPLLIWKQAYSAPVGIIYAREPSESEMRMDVYSGLAAGCKGISYFLWDAFQTGDPGLSTSLIESGDVPTSMYYAAQAMSPEVSKLGKALRYLNSSDVRYVPGTQGSWPYAANRIPAGITQWAYGAGGNSRITNVVVDSGQVGNGKDGVIGLFTDDTGRQYFMLSNQYCGPTLSAAQASLSFTVTFDGTVNQISRLSRSTGQQETMNLTNHTLNLTLPGGTGDLFCMDVNGFDRSAPSGSVTIGSGMLNLSATDDKGVTAMRFSSDRLTWTAWEPYATTRSWTFVPGYNTVYAQFKDAVGTISSVVSDSDTTAPSGSITINSSAPCTNSISVTLTPSATDTESGVYQMRFANAGSGWSAWEAYSTNKSWTMPSGDGTKIVYAQFKDFAGNYTTFSDSIILDTVAPTTPGIPTDAGAFTNSTSLVFNWTAASDTGSGIASYNCQVGTTPGGNDVFDGNIGNTFSKTVVGSHYGKRYYCRVQARDNAGNASAWSASSDGISVVEHVGITIGAAKGLLESVSVGLAGKAVTRIFGGYFYVEEMNRSAGIRVNPAGGLPDGLAVGKLVDVGGPVRTSMDYERWIDATVSVGSGTASIAPVGIGSLYLGGGDWQYSLSSVKGQRGITGAWGLNNIGLLVRTWGRVKSRDTGTSSFMISDGSGVDVKVIDLGVTPPLVDAFVVVTGIASCYSVGGEVHRLIQVTEPGGLAGLQ